MTTTELEDVFSKVRELRPAARDYIAKTLADMVEQAEHDLAFEKAMREDPEYRAYVEGALAEGEADRLAGRFEPMEQVVARMLDAHKDKHGL